MGDNSGNTLTLDRLFTISDWQDELSWEPLRAGVDIYWLTQSTQGPCTALIRYQANATVPLHRHSGFEHILVLTGAQAHERGRLDAGSLLISPPGSEHEIHSERGCIVLAIWQYREAFLPA